MKTANSSFALIFFALILCVGSGPAWAQATRTWVSGVGDDANPCSRTAPCKTFAGAISKTSAAGEINCLDPGGFGAVTITKSLTITCQGVIGGVLVSGTNGITVNLISAGFVRLRGLDIDGLGASGSSLAGVSMIGSGDLVIEDCDIYGFQGTGSGYGVYVNAAVNSHVLVENTKIYNNNIGVFVQPQGSLLNVLLIERSNLALNPTNLSVNTGALATLSESTLAASPTAIAYNGGTVTSYGNNVIRNIGSPTSILPLQ